MVLGYVVCVKDMRFFYQFIYLWGGGVVFVDVVISPFIVMDCGLVSMMAHICSLLVWLL